MKPPGSILSYHAHAMAVNTAEEVGKCHAKPEDDAAGSMTAEVRVVKTSREREIPCNHHDVTGTNDPARAQKE